MSVIDRLNKLIGDPNEKELRKLQPLIAAVRRHQQEYAPLTLADIPAKTQEFKQRIANGESVNALLPEAFGLVCRTCELLQGSTMEIGRRTMEWNMVPFDVQILGAAALHRGCIAEMKTGEGKTLVCTMPAYLNALAGKGVHVVTVNDYLATRDASWMGLLYGALGMTVGTVVHGLQPDARRDAYAADITYGTNNEFGFDYLRDNMAMSKQSQVQRSLHYAIVDEVDSILIDEARTPLIISQPGNEPTEKYQRYAQLTQELQEHVHFERDEKQRAAVLTEEGVRRMEQLLGIENIYTDRGFEEVHHIEQALRAHAIYKRDVDYVVKDGQIIIVDEFTGRLMPGRRYGHGLHQAIEAKEGVPVQRESRTLATITFQNYFRLYEKLSGMTGTAKTEEEEFESIYRLRTVVVPTHRPLIRSDRPDAIYRTMLAKFRAVVAFAMERHAQGQPVLIGTTSIEKSEVLSRMLQQSGVPHEVLNAKNHAKEAEIVAAAGERGAVTIATNMAGRGTDIKLGDGVAQLGGLCILGTERHESRRIDNQLRGRSGRQGDPGESLFFVSMEDDLMRLFSGDRLKSMMEKLNVPDDVPLQNGMVSRSIEGAQKRVEGHHFDTRKHVLQYDDVMNTHRGIIYARRQRIVETLEEESSASAAAGSLHESVRASLRVEAEDAVRRSTQGTDSDAWDIEGLCEALAALHPSLRTLPESLDARQRDADELATQVADAVIAFYEEKCGRFSPDVVALAERVVTLRSIDQHWMDHIDDMSHLREQVAFAGFAQRDPLVEYKDRAFQRFRQLLQNIDAQVNRMLLQIDFAQFAPREVLREAEQELQGLSTNESQIEQELLQTGVAPSAAGGGLVAAAARKQSAAAPAAAAKVGRNDPCPCGSGKKYKKCHGST